jgi:hypothetical protein
LHADDQPLEPILGDAKFLLILPRAIKRAAQDSLEEQTVVSDVPLTLIERSRHHGRPVYVALTPTAAAEAGADGSARPAVASIVRVRPRTHGAIRRAPRTLADLHDFLAVEGDDLVGVLRTALWAGDRSPQALAATFLLVVLAPKRRTAAGPAEDVDVWAFVVLGHTLATFGTAIGAWEIVNGAPGKLFQPAAAQNGGDVRLALGYPFFASAREQLAKYNGRAGVDDQRIVAVGAGALGSQVMLNAARAAFGRWTVIDSDLLLPHNLARHLLSADAVGFHKAMTVAITANALVPEQPNVHGGIIDDVVAPREHGGAITRALEEAELIVDLSASVPVARFLARDVTAPARRVSIFLNPDGTALTVLAEDRARTLPLDALEMQLYRAVVTDHALDGLLDAPTTLVRFGRTCRDVSVQLPQSLVSVHAGLATMALEHLVQHETAAVTVWRVDPATGAVAAIAVPTVALRQCEANGWRIITDVAVLRRLHQHRDMRLPNETGGVLLGHYDLERRILYVVDTILSPSDSHEYPTAYIRGTEGLQEAVARITAATDRQVHYVGEWHSHPRGYSCRPSRDDLALFAWLRGELTKEGLPPLMLIVGDGGVAAPYIDRIDPAGGDPAVLSVPWPEPAPGP